MFESGQFPRKATERRQTEFSEIAPLKTWISKLYRSLSEVYIKSCFTEPVHLDIRRAFTNHFFSVRIYNEFTHRIKHKAFYFSKSIHFAGASGT